MPLFRFFKIDIPIIPDLHWGGVVGALASDRCAVDSLIKPNELSVQLRRGPADSQRDLAT